MYYINMKGDYSIETIDEFETRKEAVAMLKEYNLVYRGTGYDVYVSSRSTKEWRENR